MTLVQSLAGHENYVWSASFTLDNLYVVTCSSDETARVWNAHDGTTASVHVTYTDVSMLQLVY